jgi:hypothetical protein
MDATEHNTHNMQLDLHINKREDLSICEHEVAARDDHEAESTKEECKQGHDLDDDSGEGAEEGAGPAGVILQELVHRLVRPTQSSSCSRKNR